MDLVDLQLQSLTDVLQHADYRVRGGSHAAPRLWPTGFDVLDDHLTGGFRSGDLILLGGPQGMGKTTWALQVARNIAADGRPVVYFCYEHDRVPPRSPRRARGRAIGGLDAPDLNRIRSAFEAWTASAGAWPSGSPTPGGRGRGAPRVAEYSDRLPAPPLLRHPTTLEEITHGRRGGPRGHGLTAVRVRRLPAEDPDARARREDERITVVVERLKDMTLDHDVPVLASSPPTRRASRSGKRMRVATCGAPPRWPTRPTPC